MKLHEYFKTCSNLIFSVDGKHLILHNFHLQMKNVMLTFTNVSYFERSKHYLLKNACPPLNLFFP
jgi:hypothetical protein